MEPGTQNDLQTAMEEAPLVSTLLGGGLPSEAEDHLAQAGLNYHLDAVAEKHLHDAQLRAPGHAAVLIGLYRFYFYKGRLAEALKIARLCLVKAARENGLPPAWQDVEPADAEFGRFDKILPRFFLFSLKGYAYLQMRLGVFDEGRRAVMKLLELDPSDKIGAGVLLGVLERMGREDD
jgi:tetratricopeptide (TPR) repeat protein